MNEEIKRDLAFFATAYISVDKRKNLPLSDFGWPERRLFPIISAAHVMSAARLIGRAKRVTPDIAEKIKKRIIAIARRKGYPLPSSWSKELSK